MTDQPTPETDALENSLVALDAKYPPSDNAGFVKLCTEQLIAKCRALESERDALRADVARLRAALEGMLIAEMEGLQLDGFSAAEVETEPHWMAARTALAASAK